MNELQFLKLFCEKKNEIKKAKEKEIFLFKNVKVFQFSCTYTAALLSVQTNIQQNFSDCIKWNWNSAYL